MRQPYNCSLIIQFIQLQAARPSLEKKKEKKMKGHYLGIVWGEACGAFLRAVLWR